jgi:class 3 adenylate cyclase
VSELTEQLEEAVGESVFVVAVFLDVRGFSRFAGIAESVQAAFFLKRFYLGVLTEYLPDHTFAKPSGDGLMVIFEYSEDDVAACTCAVMEGCVRLMDDYPSWIVDDPMITFEIPPNIGIGVARDAATRIATRDGRVVDYTGRPLNLAARLMGLARPQGIVVDRHVMTVLPPEHADGFESENVYMKGIAITEPRPVCFRSGAVIDDHAKRPPDQ